MVDGCRIIHYSFLFLLLIILHMQTSATATTSISSVCLACGTIKKSGKLSCCARGGSWFGDCAATVIADWFIAEVQHTWYEGIQACKGRQRNKVIRKQRNDIQENSNNTSSGAGNVTNAKTVILGTFADANASVNAPAISGANPTIDGPITPPMITHPMAEAFAEIAASSGGASIITRECDNLFEIVGHISMLTLLIIDIC